MKYTPEELYAWSLENDLKGQLVAAQYYNKQGFAARPLNGSLFKKDDQYYYQAQLVGGYEINEPVGDGSDRVNAVLDKVREHPEVMAVSIVEYNKKYHLQMVFAETEEERISQMDKKIIMDMFGLLGIDTHGKVKKLLVEVKEIQASRQAWMTIGENLKKKRALEDR